MIGFDLRGWSAWAPGHESEDDWRAWSRSPVALGSEGAPDVGFLPAMLRRRCTPLSRMMLWAAHGCCNASILGEVRTVFASRHGSINESLELLECVVEGRPLSPARFSHTVHNAQAGLFSISCGNRNASSSLAGQQETFGAGLVEALTHLEREPDRPVLLVMGDAPLAPTFAPLVDEPAVAYALGLLLAWPAGEHGFGLDLSPAAGDPASPGWPPALEFLRFVLTPQEPRLILRGPRTDFRLERGPGVG